MFYKRAILHAAYPANCHECRLLPRCLSRDLVEFQLSMFSKVARQVSPVSAREYLYRRGDSLTNLYIVRSGSLKRIHYTPDGDEVIARFYFPGDVMGLNAIVNSRYNDSVVSLETVTLCKLDYLKFGALAEKIPELNRQLLKKASQELVEEHNIRLTINTTGSAMRLAMFISHLSEKYRTNGYSQHEFMLPMSRWDIGSYLGLANETISRSLKYLVNEDLIEISGRLVRIKNLETTQ